VVAGKDGDIGRPLERSLRAYQSTRPEQGFHAALPKGHSRSIGRRRTRRISAAKRRRNPGWRKRWPPGAVDLWTVGCADPRLCAARNPVDGPWKTRCVSHRPPTGRRLPTSSTALNLIRIKSGKVKTLTQPPALAYSTPVAVQTTETTARTNGETIAQRRHEVQRKRLSARPRQVPSDRFRQSTDRPTCWPGHQQVTARQRSVPEDRIAWQSGFVQAFDSVIRTLRECFPAARLAGISSNCASASRHWASCPTAEPPPSFNNHCLRSAPFHPEQPLAVVQRIRQ